MKIFNEIDEAIDQLNIGCSVHPDLTRKLNAGMKITRLRWVHSPCQALPLRLVVHVVDRTGENKTVFTVSRETLMKLHS